MDPPPDVLADIDLRFIRTAPKESLSSPEHLMFLVEHAYWFYEDHVREKNPALRHYAKWHDFARLMFKSSPLLQPHLANFDDHMERFRKFKRLIPVYGAIVMDAAMERALLVRGLKTASGWGFPRGKVNAGEEGEDCAAREVYEETGIVVEHLINPAHKIQVTADGKPHTLFIVPGIDPDTTACAPTTKGEIGAIMWHYVQHLPSTVDEANKVYLSSTGVKHRFFMVQPFVRPLREWIRKNKGKIDNSKKINAAAVAAASAAAASAAVLAAQQQLEAKHAPVPQPSSVIGSTPVASSMSDFRFDHATIMACFAASG